MRKSPCEPRLHQRARRREQEVGQADRRAEQPQDPPARLLAACRFPSVAGDDRQRDQAQRQQPEVQRGLAPRAEPPRRPVAVCVACRQQRLEEHEAQGPHGARAAEPRDDLLRDERLNREQQERAERRRERERSIDRFAVSGRACSTASTRASRRSSASTSRPRTTPAAGRAGPWSRHRMVRRPGTARGCHTPS